MKETNEKKTDEAIATSEYSSCMEQMAKVMNKKVEDISCSSIVADYMNGNSDVARKFKELEELLKSKD